MLLILSARIQGGFFDGSVLAPLADMVNHSWTPSIKWVYSDSHRAVSDSTVCAPCMESICTRVDRLGADGTSFFLEAESPISAGDQVRLFPKAMFASVIWLSSQLFQNYAGAGNMRLLLFYGFTIPTSNLRNCEGNLLEEAYFELKMPEYADPEERAVRSRLLCGLTHRYLRISANIIPDDTLEAWTFLRYCYAPVSCLRGHYICTEKSLVWKLVSHVAHTRLIGRTLAVFGYALID